MSKMSKRYKHLAEIEVNFDACDIRRILKDAAMKEWNIDANGMQIETEFDDECATVRFINMVKEEMSP